MGRSSKISILVLTILLLLLQNVSSAEVKNVIVLIGDGMGFEQVRAASLFGYGREGALSFEEYYKGEMTTHSANSHLARNHATDSAAAVTAMATGQKVDNDVLSQDVNDPIPTMMEYCKEIGKAIGLVTTVPVTHATPAGYGAHNITRNDFNDIADDFLNTSRPNILFGTYLANGSGMTPRRARLGGYKIAQTRQAMLDIIKASENMPTEDIHLMGLFAAADDLPYEYDYYRQKGILRAYEPLNLLQNYDVIPQLSEMTSASLSVLEQDPDGFFLMVEGGSIDHAGHSNLIDRSVYATLEFEQTCNVALDWAQDREDTLVVITADHECGWLVVERGRGRGLIPDVYWGSGNHSGANVPMYAIGPGAEEFEGVVDNTDMFRIIMNQIENGEQK